MFIHRYWKDCKISWTLKVMIHRYFNDNRWPRVSWQIGLYCSSCGREHLIGRPCQKSRWQKPNWRLPAILRSRRYQSRRTTPTSRLQLPRPPSSQKYPLFRGRQLPGHQSSNSMISRRFQSTCDPWLEELSSSRCRSASKKRLPTCRKKWDSKWAIRKWGMRKWSTSTCSRPKKDRLPCTHNTPLTLTTTMHLMHTDTTRITGTSSTTPRATDTHPPLADKEDTQTCSRVRTTPGRSRWCPSDQFGTNSKMNFMSHTSVLLNRN